MAAVKVFTPDAISTVLLVLLTGAPSPYRWNAHAAHAAVYRRRILATMVAYWFAGRLRVPVTRGPTWNSSDLAFEIRSELVDASHLPLVRGTRSERDAMRPLVDEVMVPLQRHLLDAGAIGLVWQAGMGNPVAGGNFMLESRSGEGGDGWVWVDLESGIPPLVGSPLTLAGHYLPHMVRRRRLLFDDVDVPTLKAYIDANRGAMVGAVGSSGMARLEGDVEAFDRHQSAWKALNRHERSLAHAYARGWIDAGSVDYFRIRPVRWLGRQAMWGATALSRAATRGLRNAASWVARTWRSSLRHAIRFVVSAEFRSRVSRRYVRLRLLSWHSRRFITSTDLRNLRNELRRDAVARNLADFGAHLALKGPVSAVQWWILPMLFILGVIDAIALAAGVLFAESIGRTLYTATRVVTSTLARTDAPWLALLIGALPVVGISAFPLQMLYAGGSSQRALSRFIVYDTFASIGRAIPIWGGRDSLLEHRFNRIPGRFLRPQHDPWDTFADDPAVDAAEAPALKALPSRRHR